MTVVQLNSVLANPMKISEIKSELHANCYIVDSPFIITYLTNNKELFKFVNVTSNLTYNTPFQNKEKNNF